MAAVRGINRAQALSVSRRCTAGHAVCLPTRREVGLSRKNRKNILESGILVIHSYFVF